MTTIDMGTNKKPEVPYSIATIREKSAWATDFGPVRKGSKKRKEVRRAPIVQTMIVYGLFDTREEFVKAVRAEIDADQFDLRTIQFHEGGWLQVGRKGILTIDAERD